MHQSLTPSNPAPAAWLGTALVYWLVLGSVILALVPEARGQSALLGWLPFWLALAPALSLLVLQLSRLPVWLAAARARILVPGPRRRRPRWAMQAQRVGYGQSARRSRLRAA